MKNMIDRRSFMKVIGAASLTGLSTPAMASKLFMPTLKTLSFKNAHTNERIKTCFWEMGEFNEEACRELDYIMRDWRENEAIKIDRNLYQLLHLLTKLLDFNDDIILLSGYRTPKTNKRIGGARRSYHMRGQAIDFYFPGINLSALRKSALQNCFGGVGYYPKSNFIHIDTGPKRRW